MNSDQLRLFGPDFATDDPPENYERWLPVRGYEGLYEVSDLGRVRSVPREGTQGGIIKQRLLGRYLAVQLSRNGKMTTLRVHRLVGEAWLGPRPPGMQTRHGPRGAFDNSLGNLTYGTPLQNNHDQDRDGTRPRGSGKPQSRLTEAIVAECRTRHAVGQSTRTLAAEFGVSQPTMAKAVNGTTWAHLPLAGRVA